MQRLKAHGPFLIFMTVVVAAEIGCAKLAWHTIGEIASAFLLMMVWWNLFPLGLHFAGLKRGAVGIALVGALISVPFQLLLANDWRLLHQETLNVAQYAEQAKKRTGSYPANLASYTFIHPSIKEDLSYERYKPNEFDISFNIGSDTTSHIYSSDGTWFYYPD